MALELPAGVTNVESTDAAVLRHMMQGLLGAPVGAFAGGVGATNGIAHGVCGSGDFAVSQSPTPGMSVKVAKGLAIITGTSSALQGPYSVYNDADIDAVTVAAADATNPRKDLVIAQVRDTTYDGSGVRQPRVTVVTGTPAASPSDPSIAAYPSALVLARIDVPALDTSITNAQITDLRTFAGVHAGMPSCQVSRLGQSVAHNTVTNLLFTSEDFDPLGWHSTSVNTDRITPTIAGWYRVTLTVAYASDTDLARVRSAIFASNIGEVIVEDRPYDVPAGIGISVAIVSRLVRMNGSTDYFAGLAYQANTSTGANSVNAWLTVELVRL